MRDFGIVAFDLPADYQAKVKDTKILTFLLPTQTTKMWCLQIHWIPDLEAEGMGRSAAQKNTNLCGRAQISSKNSYLMMLLRYQLVANSWLRFLYIHHNESY